MDAMPRAFPSTVSASDPVCHLILKEMANVNRERRGTPKHVPCLTTIYGSRTGVYLETNDKLGEKLFSTRYVEYHDCYLLQINPNIHKFGGRIRQAACEILAMMHRGVREWTEKDPVTKEVIRTCVNAHGLAPDLEKHAEREARWKRDGARILAERRARRKKNPEEYAITHC